MLNIRYGVTEENIKKGVGHIGSGVRPSERSKGYGTEILRLCLEECKKYNLPDSSVQVVSCGQTNGRTLRRIMLYHP